MKKWFIPVLLFCVFCAAFASTAYAEDIRILQVQIRETYNVDGEAMSTLYVTFPQIDGMDNQEIMKRVNAAIRSRVSDIGGAPKQRELDYFEYAPRLSEEAYDDYYGNDVYAQAALLRNDSLLAVNYEFTDLIVHTYIEPGVDTQHFDLTSGDLVSLESFVLNPALLRLLVAEETIRWVNEREYSNRITTPEYIKAYLEDSWSLESACLTEEGLIAYGVYPDAPRSDVPVKVLVPYERLQLYGVLDPAIYALP